MNVGKFKQNYIFNTQYKILSKYFLLAHTPTLDGRIITDHLSNGEPPEGTEPGLHRLLTSTGLTTASCRNTLILTIQTECLYMYLFNNVLQNNNLHLYLYTNIEAITVNQLNNAFSNITTKVKDHVKPKPRKPSRPE